MIGNSRGSSSLFLDKQLNHNSSTTEDTEAGFETAWKQQEEITAENDNDRCGRHSLNNRHVPIAPADVWRYIA